MLLMMKEGDLPQVTDKVYHIKLDWQHTATDGMKQNWHTLVVVDSDCISRCNSTITRLCTR